MKTGKCTGTISSESTQVSPFLIRQVTCLLLLVTFGDFTGCQRTSRNEYAAVVAQHRIAMSRPNTQSAFEEDGASLEAESAFRPKLWDMYSEKELSELEEYLQNRLPYEPRMPYVGAEVPENVRDAIAVGICRFEIALAGKGDFYTPRCLKILGKDPDAGFYSLLQDEEEIHPGSGFSACVGYLISIDSISFSDDSAVVKVVTYKTPDVFNEYTARLLRTGNDWKVVKTEITLLYR